MLTGVGIMLAALILLVYNDHCGIMVHVPRRLDDFFKRFGWMRRHPYKTFVIFYVFFFTAMFSALFYDMQAFKVSAAVMALLNGVFIFGIPGLLSYAIILLLYEISGYKGVMESFKKIHIYGLVVEKGGGVLICRGTGQPQPDVWAFPGQAIDQDRSDRIQEYMVVKARIRELLPKVEVTIDVDDRPYRVIPEFAELKHQVVIYRVSRREEGPFFDVNDLKAGGNRKWVPIRDAVTDETIPEVLRDFLGKVLRRMPAQAAGAPAAGH